MDILRLRFQIKSVMIENVKEKLQDWSLLILLHLQHHTLVLEGTNR